MTAAFFSIVMHAGSALGTTPESPALKDIFFRCDSCATSLVVNSAAAGMKLTCQQCGKPTVVPKTSSKGHAPVAAGPAPEKVDDLLRRLKENESQRTEITGYINQLSIQLHRWQLRLQTLNERKKELAAEMDGIQKVAQ